MKNKKLYKGFIFIIFFTLLFLVFINFNREANAGVSNLDLFTEKMYEDELSSNYFYIKGTVKSLYDETLKRNVIYFDSKNKSQSRIVSIAYFKNLGDIGFSESLYGSYSVNISDLENDFYMLFGLKEAFYTMNQKDESALKFSKSDNKIKISLINIDKDTETIVKDVDALFDFNTELNINFSVKSTAKFSLSINNTKYIEENDEGAVSTNGYVGFLSSSGGVGVKLYNLDIHASSYDTPLNANVDETFDDGFDKSRIFVNNSINKTGLYSPEGVVAEDQQLKFKNITSFGFVSSRYEFSNFEMTFDITHLARTFTRNEKGEVISPASNFIGFSIGAPVLDGANYAITETIFVYFSPIYKNDKCESLALVLLDNFKVISEGQVRDSDNFFKETNAYDSSGAERVINMYVSMVDKVLTIKFKYAGESDSKYRILLEKNIGRTPLGYVQIHGQGYGASDLYKNDSLTCTNFDLDNLKIRNLDSNPNLIEPEFESNKIERSEDFDYIDRWDYRKDTIKVIEKEEKGCKSSLSVIPFIVLPVTLSLIFMKKRRDE